jgi:hypothetical protein
LCILWNYKGDKIWRWGWSLQCSFLKHEKCPLLHLRTKLWSLKSFKLRWILIFHLTFQLSFIKFVYMCNCVFSSCGCLWITRAIYSFVLHRCLEVTISKFWYIWFWFRECFCALQFSEIELLFYFHSPTLSFTCVLLFYLSFHHFLNINCLEVSKLQFVVNGWPFNFWQLPSVGFFYLP